MLLATTFEGEVPSSLGTQNSGENGSTQSVKIDPLIFRFLSQASSETSDSTIHSSVITKLGGSLQDVSRGIQLWRSALLQGRLPDEEQNREAPTWPPPPLGSHLVDAFVTMQLPRFVLRHPATIDLILSSLLRSTTEFCSTLAANEDREDYSLEDDDDDDDDDYYFKAWQEQYEQDLQDNHGLNDDIADIVPDDIQAAKDTVKSFLQQWSGVVEGVTILDGIFPGHGLLDTNPDRDTSLGGSTQGYGTQDGIWGHSGWQEIPTLQNELSSIAELSALIRSLGRRPTAENSDRIQRFSPRQSHRDGGMGAHWDQSLRESMDGVTLSNSISEMLPAEALLLCGNSTALRTLFLSKLAESKLWTYRTSGWEDIPSIPRRKKSRFRPHFPSALGGPIVLCLDTSWSMTGRREVLSKAVVLACVAQAHSQGRDCQVIAFSNSAGVMESGILTPSAKDGIPRLLDFLSNSFGGGTDVTGALKYAMQSLQTDISLEAADLLLVTDGEIPDPPVPAETMKDLEMLRVNKGTQIHGLLIGKSESVPLTRICTETHDFLSQHDDYLAAAGSRPSRNPISQRVGGPSNRMDSRNTRSTTALFAKRGRQTDDDDDDDDTYLSDEFQVKVTRQVERLKQTASDRYSTLEWNPDELEKERLSTGQSIPGNEIQQAIERVREGLVERDEDARLVVLSMIANEHILLLGPPGTAKSILGQRLAELCHGNFFQRLLTKFTTPEELFGPLSLKSLEQDEYRRCTVGFLPTAEIAFLDEIFKANSAILNTLLTILNERQFDNAGGREECPIRCVVGASNELPESDELVALFDRFLIRKEVRPVSDEGVLSLLELSNPGDASCTSSDECSAIFTPEGLDQLIEHLSTVARDSVRLGKASAELMRDLRIFLREEADIEISDRRLVKTARLLKICAASNGRSQVDMVDFWVLQHCFWNDPGEREIIRDWLWDHLTPGASLLQQYRFLLENLRAEILTVVQRTAGDVTGDGGARPADLELLTSLRLELKSVQDIILTATHQLARHMTLIEHSAESSVWLDPGDAQAMRQLMLPKAESIMGQLRQSVLDVLALDQAIDPQEFLDSSIMLDVIRNIWEDGLKEESYFTEEDLSLSMREAKTKFDLDTFRRWKRIKKKTAIL